MEFGTFPQLVSAFGALVAISGAIWLTVRVGHRANLAVRSEVAETAGGHVLTATVEVDAVGRWEMRPPKRLACECCDREEAGALPTSQYQAWDVRGGQLDPELTIAGLKPVRLVSSMDGVLRRKKAFDKRRREVWRCPNQKIPRVVVEELRAATDVGFQPASAFVCERRNVLMGQFISTGEKGSFSHVFVLGDPAPDVLGWRLTFQVWVKRWNWFRHAPATDCWWWTATDVVMRAAQDAPKPKPRAKRS